MISLLTGASGFLGQTISKHLLTGSMTTLGRHKSDIVCDLSNSIPQLDKYDLVIHAAGKAHSVPKTEVEKQAFFDVNVKGTENLLEGLAQAPSLPKSFIFISSVSVYGAENGTNVDEAQPLLATDSYGLSKIKAEQIVSDWCAKHQVICGILRLPLLVGMNPPGNLGAMIKGIKKGYYFNIAGGTAKKSMVLVEDVASIILKVAEIGGVYNLTDGHHPSFYELSHQIAAQLNRRKVPNMPNFLASFLSGIGDVMPKFPINSNKLAKITSDLTFDDSKARAQLGWRPIKVLDGFLIR